MHHSAAQPGLVDSIQNYYLRGFYSLPSPSNRSPGADAQDKDGSDALQDQNVGASSYAKAQGQPVKIWGLLGNGHLEYFLLPELVDIRGRKRTANMNGTGMSRCSNAALRHGGRVCFPAQVLQSYLWWKISKASCASRGI